MKLYRVLVSFEVDAENEDDAVHQAMREGPNDCMVESVREIATVDTILAAIDAMHGSDT